MEASQAKDHAGGGNRGREAGRGPGGSRALNRFDERRGGERASEKTEMGRPVLKAESLRGGNRLRRRKEGAVMENWKLAEKTTAPEKRRPGKSLADGVPRDIGKLLTKRGKDCSGSV